jgi:hypothetical protein
MGFEQIPNTPLEPSKEQPPYPGWVLENGIWRKPDEEDNAELTEQNKEGNHTKEEEANKELVSLEEELKKLDDKEYLSPDDIQKKKELEIKYTTLDKRAKETPEKKEKESKEEPSAAKTMEDKEKKDEKNEGKEKLEKGLIENYNDELEKIKQMTGNNKNLKVKKYFELINDWKDVAYLDDYKGIQKIFSEINKSKPSIFLYNYKKAEMIDEVAIAMASSYEEWGLEDKKKLKIIKSFVKKQSKEKNFWYQSDDKDKTFKDIAQILALKDVPFKGSLGIIVKDIENPNTKSETIAKILKIEKGTIEKKKQSLQNLKKDMKRDKLPPDKITIEQLEKLGIDPKAVSKILSKLGKTLENPEVQERFQELKNTIEKITKEKEEIPEAIAKAKEHIEKKESPWGTVFGAAGWGILLFLVLFILAELKGAEVLSGQSTGKKKEKK